MTISNKAYAALLSEALHYCSLEDPQPSNVGSCQTFWYGHDQLNIAGADIEKFEDVVGKLFIDEGVKKLSRDFFEKYVTNKLYLKLKECGDFSEEEGKRFREDLKKIPLEEYRVFREFRGASINGLIAPLVLGRFTLYDWATHRSLIETAYKGKPEDLWLGREFKLLVECAVEAGESGKALELADLAFSRLEGILRFMIGTRQSAFEIGILDYTGLQKHQHYIMHDGSFSMGIRAKGATRTLPLYDRYFAHPAKNFQRILDMEPKPSTSLERKIFQSIGWVAQALVDANPASAFIKTATALEVLFSSNETGVITSSIMAKISESCAHILGDSTQSCLAIERSVKKLYGIRSAVVHSGKESVNSEDLDSFIHYARQVVLNILMCDEYEGIKTIEELQEYLQSKKYNLAAN